MMNQQPFQMLRIRLLYMMNQQVTSNVENSFAVHDESTAASNVKNSFAVHDEYTATSNVKNSFAVRDEYTATSNVENSVAVVERSIENEYITPSNFNLSVDNISLTRSCEGDKNMSFIKTNDCVLAFKKYLVEKENVETGNLEIIN